MGISGVPEQRLPEDRRGIIHLYRPGCPESKHQAEGMREGGKVLLHLVAESEKLIKGEGL